MQVEKISVMPDLSLKTRSGQVENSVIYVSASQSSCYCQYFNWSFSQRENRTTWQRREQTVSQRNGGRLRRLALRRQEGVKQELLGTGLQQARNTCPSGRVQHGMFEEHMVKSYQLAINYFLVYLVSHSRNSAIEINLEYDFKFQKGL